MSRAIQQKRRVDLKLGSIVRRGGATCLRQHHDGSGQ